MTVVVVTADLLDAERLRASVPGLGVVRPGPRLLAGVTGAERVAVDLRVPDATAVIAAAAAGAEVVAYGPHVDADLLRRARHAGAGRVLARSAFFADPQRWLAPGSDTQSG